MTTLQDLITSNSQGLPFSQWDEQLTTQVQTELVRWQYLPNSTYIDGFLGPITEKAFSNWKVDNYLSARYSSNSQLIGSSSAKILLHSNLTKKPGLSALTYQLIQPFEGYLELVDPNQPQGDVTAYQDEGGVWTIGYGSTFYEDRSRVSSGDVISYNRAIQLLQYEVVDLCQYHQEQIPTYLLFTPEQRIAIGSFQFNLGEEFYGSDGFNSITELLNNPTVWVGPVVDVEHITNVFTLYDKQDGVGVEGGLLRRRRAEAAIFCFQKTITGIDFNSDDNLVLTYLDSGVSKVTTVDITS